MMELKGGEILNFHPGRLDVDGRLFELAAFSELFLPVLRTCCQSMMLTNAIYQLKMRYLYRPRRPNSSAVRDMR
jgi:hypothetical protein